MCRQGRPLKNMQSAEIAPRGVGIVFLFPIQDPPPAHESPPCCPCFSTKYATQASIGIASQLWCSPSEEHDIFVPVAKVINDLCHCNLVDNESAAGAHTADPSHHNADLSRSRWILLSLYRAQQRMVSFPKCKTKLHFAY